MYRVILPNGRVVTTYELIPVKHYKGHNCNTVPLAYANGIVFKSVDGFNYLISLDIDKEFLDKWYESFKKGYFSFHKGFYDVHTISDPVYTEIFSTLGRIR